MTYREAALDGVNGVVGWGILSERGESLKEGQEKKMKLGSRGFIEVLNL